MWDTECRTEQAGLVGGADLDALMVLQAVPDQLGDSSHHFMAMTIPPVLQ